MYTVKEVADLLDVSQVTIYNHLKKAENELKGQVTKKKRITYIKEEGLKTLKISLGIIQAPTIKETISLDETIKGIYDLVQADNNKRLDGLQEELNNNNIKLEKELQEIKKQNELLINMIQEKEKKSFIDKLKGLFKSNTL